MSFIWPAMLFSLLLVPLFVLFYILQQRRRKELAVRYGSLGLLRGALGQSPGLRIHIPPALFLTGLAILLFALARPQLEVHLPRVEGTIILAFDVSGSMAADDLQPNRMEAAKTAARSFVLRQPSTVQIGVVAFSDSGFAVQMPTNEQEAILASIDRLAPQRGTSLGQGILLSLHTIAGRNPQALPSEDDLIPEAAPDERYPASAIILLTDGENNVPPNPFDAAQAAADREVRIYTVGIGSPAGTILDINGFTVHTQLDEGVLQQIAEISGGAYSKAENEADLYEIYQNIDPQLVIRPEKMEATSIFAGASILIMLLGGAFSLLWFNRLP